MAAPPHRNIQLPIVGVNDLATTNPELAEEWDYDNNNGLRPEDVLAGSGKKINWIGKKCGHKWKAAIYNRIKGTGCPYCSGRVAISGVNDLATTNPKLAKEWDYENNNGLKPEDVMANSGRKVNWKCEKGHRWSAQIFCRSDGNGCPYCSNKRIISGVNDLATINPDLASEWDYDNNNGLKPKDFLPNSNKKVSWKCKYKQHKWIAKICDRNKGSGCPYCKKSHLEQIVEKLLIKYGIEYKAQVRFDDLKCKGYLSYDYCVSLNGVPWLMIECQGIQHFIPIEFFGGEEQYKIQKEHDGIKKWYCYENGFNLLELSFNDSEETIESLIRQVAKVRFIEREKCPKIIAYY